MNGSGEIGDVQGGAERVEKKSPPVVFDPFRFVTALIEGWKWVVAGAAAGFFLLLAAGLLRVKDKHDAVARLIKREPPTTFRAGEIGEAYTPRPLSTATLVSSALSDNVLSRVAAKSNPPISLGMLRLNASAKELRGTDFLELQIRDTRSKEAAAGLVNLWAEEIVEFTRELQARESRQIQEYLRQQLAAVEADLARVNAEILEYSRREDIVDAERQTDVFLRQNAELQLQYESARIDHETLKRKLASLESELERYSAVDDRLSSARAELSDALSKYTEQNPIVLNLKAKIEALEREATERERGLALATFADTAAGGDLYLELLDLRARTEGAARNLAMLESLREEVRRNLEALPAKVAALAKMRLAQRGLEMSRQLLSARLREAGLFAEKAPGYYEIFSPAAPGSVSSTSRYVKILLFSVAGMVFGGGLGLLFVTGRELLDQRLRTALEAGWIFGAPVLAELPKGGDAGLVAPALWLRVVSPAFRERRPAVLWAPLGGEAEARVWGALLDEAGRLLPELEVLDLGSEPCAALTRARRRDVSVLTLAEAEALAGELAAGPGLIRLAGEAAEPLVSIARILGGASLIVPADAASIQRWQRTARILAESHVPVLGVVVAGTLPWWKPRK